MRLSPPPVCHSEPTGAAARRVVLHALAFSLGGLSTRALAFENRLPLDELELKYKTPRTPGPKPTDLGPRKGGLKPCTDGKPHCFSSSPELFDDNDLDEADYGTTASWLVAPFQYDKPLAEAAADVESAIASYPPGQRGVDGGGFRLADKRSDGTAAYFYVLFESRRKGYVDDAEFFLSGGVAHVRTSSRLGYLDYGVNGKRFNWFAQRLGGISGWKTTPLRSKGHEEYFALNGVSDADVLGTGAEEVVVQKTKLPAGPARTAR